MIIDNVPDALVNELQDIYWDPENDEKAQAVKQTIVKHLSPDGQSVLVRKQDLESWLSAIKDSRKFQDEAEQDIGWVAETFYKIEKVVSGNPMKVLSKIMMGGSDKLKELGLDPDNLQRLQQIAAKYAPKTTARLLAANSK